MRKIAYYQLENRLAAAERQAHLNRMAMRALALKTLVWCGRATHDGWGYRYAVADLDAADGGILLVRSDCYTNKQKPDFAAFYLDDFLRDAEQFAPYQKFYEISLRTLQAARRARMVPDWRAALSEEIYVQKHGRPMTACEHSYSLSCTNGSVYHD
jgi:hypothetical protein